MGKKGFKRSRSFDVFKLNTSNYKKKLQLAHHLRKSKLKMDENIESEIEDDDATIGTVDSTNIEQIWDAERRPDPPSHQKSNLSQKLINNIDRIHKKFNKPVYDTTYTTSDESLHALDVPKITQFEENGLKEYYDSMLNSATRQQANMNMNPGDDFFLFWFFCSSFIPLVCSCSGPLSNIFSLLAIICPWKVHKVNSEITRDPTWCYAINCISIVFGIVSNMFLILNYRKKIRYTYGQIISISGWGIASLILTGLIVGYHAWFYENDLDKTYFIGEGFWFALVAVLLHFLNHVLLLVNELGFLLKKYKPLFNIDKVQETLIIQTVSMCVWLMIGAGTFTRVLDLRLSDSMLYCVTSVATIGAQNTVLPTNYLGQALSAIWIVCGLVMFGLIVTSIGKMMFNFSRSTLAWHRIEVLRKTVYKSHRDDTDQELSNKDAFELIKKVNKWALQIQGLFEVTIALIIFMITLMCGALVFALLEDWSYRESVYFCFFNLMTLGLGISSPETPGGKAFFCAWAIGAIPVMTILVSTMSDFLFSKLTHLEQLTFVELLVEFCLSKKYLRRLGLFWKKKENVYVDMPALVSMRTKSMFIVDGEEVCNGDDDLKDSILGVPILCHPVDMLYKLIIDSDAHHSYNFVVSDSYLNTAINTIHLANYFREGQMVDFPNDELYQQRLELGVDLKALDPDFDVDRFYNVYNIHQSDSDGVGVIQDGHRIETKFKKKKDFVLDQLSRLQVMQIELRKSVLDMCISPQKRYSYTEWQTLLRVTNQHSAVDDNLYWLRSGSPLSVPMQEPKYFTLHYMRHIQLSIGAFALAWDEKE